MNLTTYKNADRPFRCTQAQADMLDRLVTLNKGGIGSLNGYKPTTGYVPGKTPTVNLQIITRIETSKLYGRKVKAIEGITFADCATDIAKHAKLSALSAADCLKLFEDCKAAALASLNKTLDGDRSDAHRQGHDRCYIKLADGVKVNLVTEKVDGLEQPVLTDGLPTVAAILLTYLQLNKTVVVEGERKVVNSGPKVLMDKIIESKMNAKSVGIKTASLKADNFESLNVSKQTFTPDDLKMVDVSMSKSKLVALLEAAGFSEEATRMVTLLEAEGAI